MQNYFTVVEDVDVFGLVVPDCVAAFVGVAETVATGVGIIVGVGLASITDGVGAILPFGARYLPLSQTKYAANKTIMSMIITIVTFRLKINHLPRQQDKI